MDHQAQVRQVETARRHVGGDTGAGVAVAQRLQGVGALLLGHLARQADGGKAALAQCAVQAAHRLARVAEHQRAGALEIAQQIDHGVLDLARRDADRAVLDVAVRLVAAQGVDAHRLALVAPREGGDLLGDGRGEHQRAAQRRGGVEDLLQVFAEAEVKHLVGLVEDDHLEG